jgi:SAM-dependent methyltransferase
VYRGFPVGDVALLRCASDGARLEVRSDVAASEFLWNGALRCVSCNRLHPVEEGIVRLLDAGQLDEESAHEHERRDRDYDSSFDLQKERSELELAEIRPTLEAAEPLQGAGVLELGAGAGRHTVLIAECGARILAVDFSLSALRRLARRVEESWQIGLVQADCTKLVLQPASFDLVVSTLISNLPTAAHRQAMLHLVADALRQTGKYVFTAHHYSFHSRLNREPKSGRYQAGGIYRYLFYRQELKAETRARFEEVDCRPIQVVLPFTWRFRLPILRTSRIAERVPLLNRFGWLLLVVARLPARRAA